MSTTGADIHLPRNSIRIECMNLHDGIWSSTFILFFRGFLINFALFLRVKTCAALHRTFNVEPLYLQHENSGKLLDAPLFIAS